MGVAFSQFGNRSKVVVFPISSSRFFEKKRDSLRSDVVLWYYGIVVLWYYGVMVLWYYGIMVLWYYGIMVLWYYGQ